MSIDSMTEASVRTFMRTLYEWRERAQNISQQVSRSRIIFVCILLRYCGLRLGEALSFNDNEGLDTKYECISVTGKWARTLPVPTEVMKKLLELRDAPNLLYEKGSICRIDQGYLRRIFIMMSEKSGIAPINPSSLRNYREAELLKEGVPLSTVGRFLGKSGCSNPLSQEEKNTLRAVFAMQAQKQRKGHHNVFSGRITDIQKRDFTCRMGIETESGLKFHIRCPLRTATRMSLATGSSTTLSVNGLDIHIERRSHSDNCLDGQVMEILRGSLESKILVRLSESEEVSAIITENENSLSEPRLTAGTKVRLFIPEQAFKLVD